MDTHFKIFPERNFHARSLGDMSNHHIRRWNQWENRFPKRAPQRKRNHTTFGLPMLVWWRIESSTGISYHQRNDYFPQQRTIQFPTNRTWKSRKRNRVCEAIKWLIGFTSLFQCTNLNKKPTKSTNANRLMINFAYRWNKRQTITWCCSQKEEPKTQWEDKKIKDKKKNSNEQNSPAIMANDFYHEFWKLPDALFPWENWGIFPEWDNTRLQLLQK